MVYSLKGLCIFVAMWLKQLFVFGAVTWMAVAAAQERQSVVLAFGAGANQRVYNPMWRSVASYHPDAFVWLGDVVFPAEDDSLSLQRAYAQQGSQRAYRGLKSIGIDVIGTWDNRDYGGGAAGADYPHKERNKQALLGFLEVDEKAAVCSRPGMYQTYTYGHQGLKVQVILLDTRWFRSSLSPNQPWGYQPAQEGTVLGTAQWRWLERILAATTADLVVVVSAIQVIPSDHPWEKWANFPQERRRLLDALAACKAPGILILSGNRNHAELSSMVWGPRRRTLYEVTTGGMTQVNNRSKGEVNTYREGPLVLKRNWGLLEVNRHKGFLWVDVDVRGASDSLFMRRSLFFKE